MPWKGRTCRGDGSDNDKIDFFRADSAVLQNLLRSLCPHIGCCTVFEKSDVRGCPCVFGSIRRWYSPSSPRSALLRILSGTQCPTAVISARFFCIKVFPVNQTALCVLHHCFLDACVDLALHHLFCPENHVHKALGGRSAMADNRYAF